MRAKMSKLQGWLGASAPRSLQLGAVAVGLLSGLGAIAPAQALPGERTEVVEAWIQAHPTLQPASGEKLVVRKSDSAAQRFEFKASVFPPGRIAPTRDKSLVRTESLLLFDAINGVTPERIEESLRVIYGLDVFQDYSRARLAYAYPAPVDRVQALNRRTPLQAGRRGELRLGDRFGYWMEVVRDPKGKAFSGQVVVFLKEDFNKVESEVRNR
jgi:hypothetical protein